jgi:hypothetical protein
VYRAINRLWNEIPAEEGTVFLIQGARGIDTNVPEPRRSRFVNAGMAISGYGIAQLTIGVLAYLYVQPPDPRSLLTIEGEEMVGVVTGEGFLQVFYCEDGKLRVTDVSHPKHMIKILSGRALWVGQERMYATMWNLIYYGYRHSGQVPEQEEHGDALHSIFDVSGQDANGWRIVMEARKDGSIALDKQKGSTRLTWIVVGTLPAILASERCAFLNRAVPAKKAELAIINECRGLAKGAGPLEDITSSGSMSLLRERVNAEARYTEMDVSIVSLADVLADIIYLGQKDATDALTPGRSVTGWLERIAPLTPSIKELSGLLYDRVVAASEAQRPSGHSAAAIKVVSERSGILWIHARLSLELREIRVPLPGF